METLSYGNIGGLPRTGAITGDNLYRYRYDGHGNLVQVRTAANEQFRAYTRDALGERYWDRSFVTGGMDTAFRPYSDGIRPEVSLEINYTLANGASSWVQQDTDLYVLGPNPDERLIWIDGDTRGPPEAGALPGGSASHAHPSVLGGSAAAARRLSGNRRSRSAVSFSLIGAEIFPADEGADHQQAGRNAPPALGLRRQSSRSRWRECEDSLLISLLAGKLHRILGRQRRPAGVR